MKDKIKLYNNINRMVVIRQKYICMDIQTRGKLEK